MLQSDWLSYRTLSAFRVQWLSLLYIMAVFSRSAKKEKFQNLWHR